MKKILGIFLSLTLSISLFLGSASAAEKTLGQLKKEFADLEASLNNNKNETKLTEEQVNEVNQNIANIEAEIKSINNEVQTLVAEIDKLNKEIEKKNTEIKSIINFVQVASGENAYMEYVFGAKDFTDFIYRVAISEQMVNYNDKLIEEYNNLVEKNNQKQASLKEKQVSLGQKQQELEMEKAKLGEKLETLQEGKLDLDEQIKTTKEAINGLKGCKDSESASACAARLAAEAGNSGGIITGGAFKRPISSGSISSNYGWRFHPTLNKWRLHTGIDMSQSGSAVPIYASASGRVAAITRRSSCGGNVIYIHHNINGKTYTSVYMHLRSIMVSVGQTVTASTQIATMGGNPSIEYWDGCSTGQHLHFTLANGLYFIDYTSYSTFESKTFDPRKMVSFPGVGGSFSGR